jgi:hypothetical protein
MKTRQRLKEETDEYMNAILEKFEKNNPALLNYIYKMMTEESIKGVYTLEYYTEYKPFVIYMVKYLRKMGFTVNYCTQDKCLFISWE